VTHIHTVIYAAGVSVIILGGLILAVIVAAVICEITPIGGVVDRLLNGPAPEKASEGDLAELLEFRWPDQERDAA